MQKRRVLQNQLPDCEPPLIFNVKVKLQLYIWSCVAVMTLLSQVGAGK